MNAQEDALSHPWMLGDAFGASFTQLNYSARCRSGTDKRCKNAGASSEDSLTHSFSGCDAARATKVDF